MTGVGLSPVFLGDHPLCLEWYGHTTVQATTSEYRGTRSSLLYSTIILEWMWSEYRVTRSSLLYSSTITLECMRSLSRMKNDRDLVNTLSSSSLSYTFTWVISRMCIEVPNLVIYNSNLRHRYMAIRLLWLLSNKGLLRLHILFFFCNWEMWSICDIWFFRIILENEAAYFVARIYFFLFFLLMLAICGIPVVYLGPQISVNFPICLYSFRRALLTTTLQGSTI